MGVWLYCYNKINGILYQFWKFQSERGREWIVLKIIRINGYVWRLVG